MKAPISVLRVWLGWVLARGAEALLEKNFQGNRVGAELSAVIRCFRRRELLLRRATPVRGEPRQHDLAEFFAHEREWLSGRFAQEFHEEIHREDVTRFVAVLHRIFPNASGAELKLLQRHVGALLLSA